MVPPKPYCDLVPNTVGDPHRVIGEVVVVLEGDTGADEGVERRLEVGVTRGPAPFFVREGPVVTHPVVGPVSGFVGREVSSLSRDHGPVRIERLSTKRPKI